MPTIDLVKDSTMLSINGKLDDLCASVSAIASKQYNITSWADVQRIVRAGLAPKVFAIGDQLMCYRADSATASVGESTGITAATVDLRTLVNKLGKSDPGVYVFTYGTSGWTIGEVPATLSEYGITVTGTPSSGDTVTAVVSSSELVWDIIGFDHDTPTNESFVHSMALQLHDVYLSMQYDAPQALYYAESQLAAGTYYFVYDTSSNFTAQFTLTQAVPAGGQIVVAREMFAEASTMKINTFASSTATQAIESNIAVTIGGTSGTQLTNINNYVFAWRGSPVWKDCSLRQNLNSSAKANEDAIWTPTGIYSRKPSFATPRNGFLYAIDPEFASAIGAVTKTTYSYFDHAPYTHDDKVFIPSTVELGGVGDSYMNTEGTVYEYYDALLNNHAKSDSAIAQRVKYLSSTATVWRTRTTNSSVDRTRCVNNSGATAGTNCTAYAVQSIGVVPACNIV